MQKKIISFGLAAIITFCLAAIADLLPFWMPMMGELYVLVAVTIFLLGWAGFIVSERAADEREVYLAMQSGRFAYVAGLLMLVLAMVVQGLSHSIDPWVPMTLAVMVVVKLFGRTYFD
jgi:nicotinamide riboside transporter PnuC